MRLALFAVLVLLAACSGRPRSELSADKPGVDIAQAALRGGSPQVALQVTANVLRQHPGNEAALVVQGDALTALGRYEEASASYRSALKANATSPDALIGLGRLSLAGDPTEAERLFLEALSHEPRNTTALNDLGVARDLQGRHADAQSAYRQALGVDPQFNAAQVNLALSMAMMGQASAAIGMLQPLATEPGASRKVKHDYAAVLTMAGRRDDAERILSADLPPDQVHQAMEAYASGGRGGGTAQVTAPASDKVAAIALAPPAPAASKPGGRVQVQFAAAPSENGAQTAWQQLQERMPSLLQDRVPEFTRVERDGHMFWRVRTGGFADPTAAEAFCRQVRDAGGPCTVAGS